MEGFLSVGDESIQPDSLVTDARLSFHEVVQIYCHGYPCARCKARDIGPEGIFVDKCVANVTRRMPMEVEFAFGADPSRIQYRLPVYVAQRTQDGIDLRFRPDAADEVDSFKRHFWFVHSLSSVR